MGKWHILPVDDYHQIHRNYRKPHCLESSHSKRRFPYLKAGISHELSHIRHHQYSFVDLSLQGKENYPKVYAMMEKNMRGDNKEK